MEFVHPEPKNAYDHRALSGYFISSFILVFNSIYYNNYIVCVTSNKYSFLTH